MDDPSENIANRGRLHWFRSRAFRAQAPQGMSKNPGRDGSACRLVNAPLVHQLEQLVVITVVNMNSDDNRSGRRHCFSQSGGNLVRRADHHARCAERLLLFECTVARNGSPTNSLYRRLASRRRSARSVSLMVTGSVTYRFQCHRSSKRDKTSADRLLSTSFATSDTHCDAT